MKKVKSMQFFQTGFEMFKGRKHNELDKKNLFGGQRQMQE